MSKAPATKLQKFLRHPRVIQFGEYLVGGSLYFWIGLGVFALCHNVFHWNWIVSKALSDVLGWTLNYLIQRYWAFYDKRLKGQDRRVVIRYTFINAVDLIFDYAIVFGFVHFQINIYIGFVVSAFFTTVWDYLWYRYWVFKPVDSHYS